MFRHACDSPGLNLGGAAQLKMLAQLADSIDQSCYLVD
jgi:hypothetical protein